MPEAFGLARSSVSRRFIRASARALRRLQVRPFDDAQWLVLVLDGKTFAAEQLVIALGVTVTGEKQLLGLTGRGRTVVIRAQAERLPMMVVGIEPDEEAPLPREAA